MGKRCLEECKEKDLYHDGEVPKELIDPNEKLIGIFYRKDWYEVHFDKRVEFRTLDGKCLGWSEVESVE